MFWDEIFNEELKNSQILRYTNFISETSRQGRIVLWWLFNNFVYGGKFLEERKKSIQDIERIQKTNDQEYTELN